MALGAWLHDRLANKRRREKCNITQPQFCFAMDIEIINKSFKLDIYGFSGLAINKDHTGTAFKLMDKMWQAVKSNNLKNKGLNVFVFEANEKVFAGVELNDTPKEGTALEHKSVSLSKYAYYKHIGPYSLIKKIG